MKNTEGGSISLISLAFTALLIGIAALAAAQITNVEARRAEVRKIEAAGLAAMERSGGAGQLACQLVLENSSITCEFGGEEIVLGSLRIRGIRVGWRGQKSDI